MFFSTRAIFQTSSLTPSVKFISASTVSSVTGTSYDSDKSMAYYYRSPDATYTTSMGDSGNIVGTGMAADGFGWCGAVTFKYKTASNYVFGDTFWNDANVERIRAYGSGDYSLEFFMIDGVLKKDLSASPNIDNYYPVTIGRKKTTHELSITTEYSEFSGVWFNSSFDTYADRWLTLVWSIADKSAFTNYAHESSKYGAEQSWQTKGSRFSLYDARTGELLETTDKSTTDSLAGGGSGYGFQDYSSVTNWSFSQSWTSGTYDFEINNNNGAYTNDGDMVKIASVWHSIGGSSSTYGISAPFDPLYFHRNKDYTAIGTRLPRTILGRNALLNMTTISQDGTNWYGFRDGIVSVSSPANAVALYDTTVVPRPISNDHP